MEALVLKNDGAELSVFSSIVPRERYEQPYRRQDLSQPKQGWKAVWIWKVD